MYFISAWGLALFTVLAFMFVRRFQFPEKKKPQPTYRPKPQRVRTRADKIREVKQWLNESLRLIDEAITEPRANAAAKQDIYRQYLWKIKRNLN